MKLTIPEFQIDIPDAAITGDGDMSMNLKVYGEFTLDISGNVTVSGGGSAIEQAVAASADGGFFLDSGTEAGYTDGESVSSFSTDIGTITAFTTPPTWSGVGLGFNITDGLKCPGLTGTKSIFFVVSTSDVKWMALSTSATGGLAGVVEDTTGLTDVSAGTPDYYANGVLISSPVRSDLFSSWSTGSKVLISIRNLDFDAIAAWGVNFNLFRWRDGSGDFNLSGLVADIVLIDEQGNDVAAAIEAELAARHGITL